MQKSKIAGQAIVIPGEASETDEEIEFEQGQTTSTTANLPTYPTKFSSHQHPLNSSQNPKHDGLLHRKLRDAQINLAIDTGDFTGKETHRMTSQLQRIAQNVHASQLILQDATCHIRSVAEDLYKIDDNLDAVFDSHSLIPDLINFDDYPTIKQNVKLNK